MATPVAAAVYARISSDIEGSGLRVKRQVEDCRRLALQLGWVVAEEYIDNDLSAYSGKHRPQYQRMLDDLRDAQRDAVIVYHVDRLTRRPIELEEFVAVVDAAKVRHVRFVVGDTDLSTGDGLLFARMLGAIASHESATKSRRVARKMEQNAAAGLPHGGYRRPFGYENDKVTVRADEAAIIRRWSRGSWPVRACDRWPCGWTPRGSARSAASSGAPRLCGRWSPVGGSPVCASTGERSWVLPSGRRSSPTTTTGASGPG